MRINSQYHYPNTYKLNNYTLPTFGVHFTSPKFLKDVFIKHECTPPRGISRIRNIHSGKYGTECKNSIPLQNIEEKFQPEMLKELYTKGISTNTEGYANCFLKTRADNPVSTSSVYDCSVLYLFNTNTNTHFLYHSYCNVEHPFYNKLIKTFMPEGFTRAALLPGNNKWTPKHHITLKEMFKAIKKDNKTAEINVYHYNSALPEIVGYKGILYEIPNARTAIGLSDNGQASFEICDLQLKNILDYIDYAAISSEKIKLQREFFAGEKYDDEILKILNNILDERQKNVARIETCKTIEELDNLIKNFGQNFFKQYQNAFSYRQYKILYGTKPTEHG